MATTVWVLTERGTSAEAAEAREIFGGEGIAVVIGTASMHAPGQRLRGDVVVIGGGAPTAEQDATGEVKRYASLATARSARARSATAAARAEPEPEPEPEPTPEPEPEPEPEPKGDDLDDMDRVTMIQHAAARWPGRRRWANLPDDELRAAIRELGD